MTNENLIVLLISMIKSMQDPAKYLFENTSDLEMKSFHEGLFRGIRLCSRTLEGALEMFGNNQTKKEEQDDHAQED